jgi:dual specificity MAP kinase phosphatase
MAAIALPRPIPPHRPSAIAIKLDSRSGPPAQTTLVPNKHIPVCPVGSAPVDDVRSLPPTTGLRQGDEQTSLLYPPGHLARIDEEPTCLYRIDATTLVSAVDHTSRQPMPDPSQVFPWLHGLHPQNHIQQAFFTPRRRTPRRPPACLRGLTLVKADGDLTTCRLKGAITPQELMQPSTCGTGLVAEFIDADPRDGFSVRNFHIQAAKLAMLADIVVYGDDEATVVRVGRDIARAQIRWRQGHDALGISLPEYNTFVCVARFDEFASAFPHLVAVDASGSRTGYVLDFFLQERNEMYAMTMASEISHNVWVGPTPYPASDEELLYDVLIECSDLGRLNPGLLRNIAEGGDSCTEQQFLDFPSSGSIPPPTWSQADADAILETCKWLYHLSHGTLPNAPQPPSAFDLDSDVDMDPPQQKLGPSAKAAIRRPRKILIHCADGYTESTMLAIAFFSYSSGRPVPDAWLSLHTIKKRNFFAYPTDVALLTAIAPRLLHESPVCSGLTLADLTALVKDEPRWLAGLDGSFPSRILDYMYLGNLGHANNPDLLKALGIGQILSVGEMPMWREGEETLWGAENLCTVQGVQDNGIDPLTNEFERCLEFIGTLLPSPSPPLS